MIFLFTMRPSQLLTLLLFTRPRLHLGMIPQMVIIQMHPTTMIQTRLLPMLAQMH
jgi:hypothetical protein